MQTFQVDRPETEYIGSGVSFFFQDDGFMFHVLINESGHVGVYMGDQKAWEYDDWMKFKEEFPQFEEVVTAITVAKLTLTTAMVQSLEGREAAEVAIADAERHMYC